MKKLRCVLVVFVLVLATVGITLMVVAEFGKKMEKAAVAPTDEDKRLQQDTPSIPQEVTGTPREASPIPPEGFSILFESSPDCTAPCWRGLRPGVTTWPELTNWIDEFGDKFEPLKCMEGTNTWCYWTDTETGITVRVYVKDGVVNTISLHGGTIVTDPEMIQQIHETADAKDPSQYVNEYVGYQGILGLKLDTVVKQIGYPDSYSAYVVSFGRHDGLVLQYVLFYEKEGIVLELPIEFTKLEQPSCAIRITPDQPILYVYFYDTGGELALEYADLYDVKEPWPGFGVAAVTHCRID